MTNATITFTASLNLDSPTFPPELSPIERIEYWVKGAKEEPLLAFMAIADWKISGEVESPETDIEETMRRY